MIESTRNSAVSKIDADWPIIFRAALGGPHSTSVLEATMRWGFLLFPLYTNGRSVPAGNVGGPALIRHSGIPQHRL